MQYSSTFHGRTNDNFQMKNCDIFLIFAKNIDCGTAKVRRLYCVPTIYVVEQKGEMNTHVNPRFTLYKGCVMGYKYHGLIFMLINILCKKSHTCMS